MKTLRGDTYAVRKEIRNRFSATWNREARAWEVADDVYVEAQRFVDERERSVTARLSSEEEHKLHEAEQFADDVTATGVFVLSAGELDRGVVRRLWRSVKAGSAQLTWHRIPGGCSVGLASGRLTYFCRPSDPLARAAIEALNERELADFARAGFVDLSIELEQRLEAQLRADLEAELEKFDFATLSASDMHDDFFYESCRRRISIDEYVDGWTEEKLFEYALHSLRELWGKQRFKTMRRFISAERRAQIIDEVRQGLEELRGFLRRAAAEAEGSEADRRGGLSGRGPGSEPGSPEGARRRSGKRQ